MNGLNERQHDLYFVCNVTHVAAKYVHQVSSDGHAYLQVASTWQHLGSMEGCPWEQLKIPTQSYGTMDTSLHEPMAKRGEVTCPTPQHVAPRKRGRPRWYRYHSLLEIPSSLGIQRYLSLPFPMLFISLFCVTGFDRPLNLDLPVISLLLRRIIRPCSSDKMQNILLLKRGNKQLQRVSDSGFIAHNTDNLVCEINGFTVLQSRRAYLHAIIYPCFQDYYSRCENARDKQTTWQEYLSVMFFKFSIL